VGTDITTDEGYRLTTENISGTIAAYLYLPNHPTSAGCVARSVRLAGLMPDYKGPDIVFDLDASGTVIGIELLS
jgi:Protein of unknown function (DUF2283)